MIEAAGLLVVFGLSIFAGHGIGYARAVRAHRARIRRVGSPE